MSIESVMPPNHLILCHPLLLLPSIFPSIRVFSNDSVLGKNVKAEAACNAGNVGSIPYPVYAVASIMCDSFVTH